MNGDIITLLAERVYWCESLRSDLDLSYSPLNEEKPATPLDYFLSEDS